MPDKTGKIMNNGTGKGRKIDILQKKNISDGGGRGGAVRGRLASTHAAPKTVNMCNMVLKIHSERRKKHSRNMETESLTLLKLYK